MKKILTLTWVISLAILILNGLYGFTAIKYSKSDVAVYNSFINWKTNKANEYKMVLTERIIVEKQEGIEVEEPKNVKGMNLVKMIQKEPIKIKPKKFKRFKFDKNEILLIEENIEDFKELNELKNDIQNFFSGLLIFCFLLLYVNRNN